MNSLYREAILGLIGYPLSHSFSKKYFTKKFENEGISNCSYELFPIEKIELLPQLIRSQPNLVGLNVTIPYKEMVQAYLDEIDASAALVGAVNTIKIQTGKLKGFNTDVYGFECSLLQKLKEIGLDIYNLKALILGTGGAAKAVAYVLKKLHINYQYVSRKKDKAFLTYQAIDASIINQYHLIINTTPLGMSPQTDNCPNLPYHVLSPQHLLYDLVYNPPLTLFLKKGIEQKSHIKNGLEMLHLQAEKAWDIWCHTSF